MYLDTSDAVSLARNVQTCPVIPDIPYYSITFGPSFKHQGQPVVCSNTRCYILRNEGGLSWETFADTLVERRDTGHFQINQDKWIIGTVHCCIQFSADIILTMFKEEEMAMTMSWTPQRFGGRPTGSSRWGPGFLFPWSYRALHP